MFIGEELIVYLAVTKKQKDEILYIIYLPCTLKL